jgi:PIN domain nuclease of toxin-antitoxin system
MKGQLILITVTACVCAVTVFVMAMMMLRQERVSSARETAMYVTVKMLREDIEDLQVRVNTLEDADAGPRP